MLDILALSAFNDNYIWMIINSHLKQAICVDPGTSVPVIEMLNQQQLKLSGIFITHHHNDHTGGVSELRQKYQPTIYGPAQLENMCDVTLKDQQTIHVENFGEWHILTTPGHTLDHIAFHNEHHLFPGDTLFSGGCGRLFEGSAAQMYNSLSKLAALPEHLFVYCAHEYTCANIEFALKVDPNNLYLKEYAHTAKTLRTQNQPTLPVTIGHEKRINPFLRAFEPEIVSALQERWQCNIKSPSEAFRYLRQWKDVDA